MRELLRSNGRKAVALAFVWIMFFNVQSWSKNNPTDVTTQDFKPKGFRCPISNVKFIEKDNGVETETSLSGYTSQDISLEKMALDAMHYIVNNPRKERGCETRFTIAPLHFPPVPLGCDTTAIADMDNRLDRAFIYMREVSGSKDGLDVQDGLRKRILGYVREDGYSWSETYSLLDATLDSSKHAVLSYATARTIDSLSETYSRTGNLTAKEQAKKMVHALISLASWKDGKAWFEGGHGPWRNGRWIRSYVTGWYPIILEHIVRYWEVTGDKDALFFALAFADGTVTNAQKTLTDEHKIREDGSFLKNSVHAHTYAALGVAHIGSQLRHPRYLDWSKKLYDYVVSIGTDYGWFPESVGRGVSETCATGDMVEIACWLAKGGYPEYWDHAERFVRNSIQQAQFFITPQYMNLYRKLHPDKADEGIAMMRELEGGFVGILSPNDWTWRPNEMDMMGCCTASACRAIYAVWKNIITESPEGVFVNLSFNADRTQAKVISFLPSKGQLTVLAKKDGDFFLRPPAWAPRDKVRVLRNGKSVPVQWQKQKSYVKFSGVKKDEKLSITYPMLSFTQKISVGMDENERSFTVRWLGNTVVDIEPKGKYLPIFTGSNSKSN